MLEKIISIDNVGVMRKGVPAVVTLSKVTLVYADNARGKSTFSSLLLACSDANIAEVINRRTVGSTSAQKVLLRFKLPVAINAPTGANAFNSEFDGSVWKGPKPNLHVFNQTFIERNVFASSGVMPEQREALLTLALGDAAVAERVNFENKSELQRSCAAKVATAEGALVGFRGTLSVDEFIALAHPVDIEKQLVNIEKKIAEVRAAEQIAARPNFEMVRIPSFNFDGLADIVTTSYTSMAAGATDLAKAHFARHNGADTEKWVLEGIGTHLKDGCPFCAQNIEGLPLLDAYKNYFDSSYKDYLKGIASFRQRVVLNLEDRQLISWEVAPIHNNTLLSVWSESIEISSVPTLDLPYALAILARSKVNLLSLVEDKERSPLVELNATPLISAQQELESLIAMAKTYNADIEELNKKITAYKARFNKSDVRTLENRRTELEIQRRRHELQTVTLVELILKTRAEYKNAGIAKTSARNKLDHAMVETLTKFQKAINDWLTKFSAPFSVEKLAPSYLGNSGVRSEYVLKVRGTDVYVGPGTKGHLSFHTALSEGDKRTLAFAFFLARLFSDPNIDSSSVVLDDVFTSLDKHRRHNTIESVLKMVDKCSQVIALGHDAHFLREIKKRATRNSSNVVAELSLYRDVQDYSYVDTFDLDDFCSSDYYKHYVKVEKFVGAEPGYEILEVAKSLRLLIEGHLHRCFPKKFKEGQTVGAMLSQVENATELSSLFRLQPYLDDLKSFNEFAAAFHHDTSGGYTREVVTEAELLPFARGALGFIQIRSFNTK